MSAAINCLRAGRKTLIIEKEAFGGQIASSPRVENFPSRKEISGLDLSQKLLEQIIDLGAEFEFDNVIKLEKVNNIFQVETPSKTFEAKSVIIAVGLKHRKLNIPSEEKFFSKGISYCAVCDGAFYKGENVIVIGDANTALQYALLLSTYCKKVYLCALFDKLFADQILIERIKKKDNIEIIYNVSCQQFIGDKDLERVHFLNLKTNKEIEIEAKAAFIAIGQIPNNEIFKNYVDLDDKGFIVVDEKMQTKTKGLFAAGDCIKKNVYQLITGMSEGSIAALSATRYLDD